MQYVCECGWVCTSDVVIEYHKSGACKRMRLLAATMAARERNGVMDHTGLRVAGLEIKEQL